MKIILSRKGFDSQNGRKPSPIFPPDGSLCSLPIPERGGFPRMEGVRWQDRNLALLVKQLTGKQFGGVHLDPDLRREARPRKPGWLPMFGQVDAAQGHLENENVGFGDIFLFFGWFRETRRKKGKWEYVLGAPDLHVIFGWLQVDRIWKPSRKENLIPAWAFEHPHVARHRKNDSNTVYVASRRLHLPGFSKKVSGGGVFSKYIPSLRLTATGDTNPKEKRTVWQLPQWCYPRDGHYPLTYHDERKNRKRCWWRKGKDVILHSVNKGQEFVLDCKHYPEAIGWLKDIFANARA